MKVLLLASVFFLCSCAFSQPQPEAPAIIVQPTEAGRAELFAAVTGALNVESVVVADDALTQSSSLVIGRGHARDASGRQLSGRDLDQPQHFRLVLSGGHCVLIHQESSTRTELRRSTCAPK